MLCSDICPTPLTFTSCAISPSDGASLSLTAEAAESTTTAASSIAGSGPPAGVVMASGRGPLSARCDFGTVSDAHSCDIDDIELRRLSRCSDATVFKLGMQRSFRLQPQNDTRPK
jgi:hypothetical protein